MAQMILRRLLLLIPTLIFVSMVSFLIIQAPPGNWLDSYAATLASQNRTVDQAILDSLRVRYGLDSPVYVQYLKWIGGVLRGDLGRSLSWGQPVSRLIMDRLPWSVLISLAALIFVYLVGIPIGIFSATHKYTVPDYLFTFLGFIGLATPAFLLALIMLWIYFLATGNAAVSLFSPTYQAAAWSWAKLIDLLKHLWMPTLIVGASGTAELIRLMRANLLDELPKPYVMVARAKGLSKRRVLYKYPLRIAVNPVISTIGWKLPSLFNGEVLTSIVLGIPTLGPLLLRALLSQDMYLAGSIVLIMSALTVVGTLISDLLLAWVDPRIRESV